LWIMPLVSDTFVFILTIWATQLHPKAYRGRRAPIIQQFRKDGTLYFLCIFGANLLNILFYTRGPQDLRSTAAGFSVTLTTTMVSRLVLNLKGLNPEISSVRESKLIQSGLKSISDI
ncbi:hypothetical protein M422DRAFT_196381, partial [Sphaerobolus stellatus SS14]